MLALINFPQPLAKKKKKKQITQANSRVENLKSKNSKVVQTFTGDSGASKATRYEDSEHTVRVAVCSPVFSSAIKI